MPILAASINRDPLAGNTHYPMGHFPFCSLYLPTTLTPKITQFTIGLDGISRVELLITEDLFGFFDSLQYGRGSFPPWALLYCQYPRFGLFGNKMVEFHANRKTQHSIINLLWEFYLHALSARRKMRGSKWESWILDCSALMWFLRMKLWWWSRLGGRNGIKPVHKSSWAGSGLSVIWFWRWSENDGEKCGKWNPRPSPTIPLPFVLCVWDLIVPSFALLLKLILVFFYYRHNSNLKFTPPSLLLSVLYHLNPADSALRASTVPASHVTRSLNRHWQTSHQQLPRGFLISWSCTFRPLGG